MCWIQGWLEKAKEQGEDWKPGELEASRQGSSWVFSLPSLPCNPPCAQVVQASFGHCCHCHHNAQVSLQPPSSRSKSATPSSKSCLPSHPSGTSSAKQPIHKFISMTKNMSVISAHCFQSPPALGKGERRVFSFCETPAHRLVVWI